MSLNKSLNRGNIKTEVIEGEMDDDPKKIRELLDKYPKLYDYDYKWKDSKNYKDLNEILEVIGYKLVDDEVKAGDYNDIKGYFGCEVKKL